MVQVVADEHRARTAEGVERGHGGDVAAADGVDGADLRVLGQRRQDEPVLGVVEASALGDVDEAAVGLEPGHGVAEADLAFLLAAEGGAAEGDEHGAGPIVQPLAEQVGGGGAGGAVVHADVGEAAAAGDVGDQGDDRDAGIGEAGRRGGDLRYRGGLEDHAL